MITCRNTCIHIPTKAIPSRYNMIKTTVLLNPNCWDVSTAQVLTLHDKYDQECMSTGVQISGSCRKVEVVLETLQQAVMSRAVYTASNISRSNRTLPAHTAQDTNHTDHWQSLTPSKAEPRRKQQYFVEQSHIRVDKVLLRAQVLKNSF